MDVLSDVLGLVRIHSQVYGRLELGAPWGIRTAANDHVAFYVVSRGSCWLDCAGLPAPLLLGGGDFVFLPRGVAYELRDHPDSPTMRFEDLLASRPEGSREPLKSGGSGPLASLVCGCFAFEGGCNPLVESLPTVIHVRADAPEGSLRWLESTLQFVASEAASPRPGAEIVANRLADILFVQAVRAYLATPEGAAQRGWLASLADPQVGRALQLMHERPDDRWTLERLADAVCMSRSAFAAKFRELVGETPMNYLPSGA